MILPILVPAKYYYLRVFKHFKMRYYDVIENNVIKWTFYHDFRNRNRNRKFKI